jgi:hypothetical protein
MLNISHDVWGNNIEKKKTETAVSVSQTKQAFKDSMCSEGGSQKKLGKTDFIEYLFSVSR